MFSHEFNVGYMTSGYCWDKKTKQRFDDPLFLESYGYKVYSQNDEDGIIDEIFKRIGTTNKRFIEFGVQDGLECNSHYLLFKEWSGLWIDGDSDMIKSANNKFRPVIDNGQLKIVNAFITSDNINKLFSDNGFTGEIDLLSIDIDGNDYHVWKAINVISPRVVIIEYNGKFPPDCEWVMAYNENHLWDGSDKHGASLKSYELLGKSIGNGYQLVGTNIRGVNAFFVRKDLVADFFPKPATAENLYNPFRVIVFQSGHPAKVCLKNGVEGLQGVFLNQPKEICFLCNYGFHAPEYNEDGSFSVQWMSADEAKIFVRVSVPIALGLTFVLCAGVDTDLIIQVEQFEAEEHHVTQSNDEPIIIEYNFPKNTLYSVDDIIEITLRVNSLWSPCRKFGSNDTRNLGVGILDIRM